MNSVNLVTYMSRSQGQSSRKFSVTQIDVYGPEDKIGKETNSFPKCWSQSSCWGWQEGWRRCPSLREQNDSYTDSCCTLYPPGVPIACSEVGFPEKPPGRGKSTVLQNCTHPAMTLGKPFNLSEPISSSKQQRCLWLTHSRSILNVSSFHHLERR